MYICVHNARVHDHLSYEWLVHTRDTMLPQMFNAELQDAVVPHPPGIDLRCDQCKHDDEVRAQDENETAKAVANSNVVCKLWDVPRMVFP